MQIFFSPFSRDGDIVWGVYKYVHAVGISQNEFYSYHWSNSELYDNGSCNLKKKRKKKERRRTLSEAIAVATATLVAVETVVVVMMICPSLFIESEAAPDTTRTALFSSCLHPVWRGRDSVFR